MKLRQCNNKGCHSGRRDGNFRWISTWLTCWLGDRVRDGGAVGKIERDYDRSSVESEGSEEDFVVGDTVSFEKGVFNNSNDGFNEGAFNGYTISDLEVVAVSFNNQIFVGEDGFTFDRDKDEFIGLDKERARLD